MIKKNYIEEDEFDKNIRQILATVSVMVSKVHLTLLFRMVLQLLSA
jgi:hypothetical protein